MPRTTRTLPIGTQVAMLRDCRGLSQNALVAKLGGTLSKGGLSQIETNSRKPNLTSLEALAQPLRCTFVVTAKRTFIEELDDLVAAAKARQVKAVAR